MDPVIQQIARAGSIEPHFLNVLKRHLVGVVQPQLDELEQLLAEVVTLRARVAELEAQPKKSRTGAAA